MLVIEAPVLPPLRSGSVVAVAPVTLTPVGLCTSNMSAVVSNKIQVRSLVKICTVVSVVIRSAGSFSPLSFKICGPATSYKIETNMVAKNVMLLLVKIVALLFITAVSASVLITFCCLRCECIVSARVMVGVIGFRLVSTVTVAQAAKV